MIFDFKYKKITWEELSIPMNKSKNHMSNLCIEDKELPKNIGIETNRVSRGINPNKYGRHNYYDMVNNCMHLTIKEKSDITNLFKEFQDLFSGKLGKVPEPPVKLK